ncbi:hypothetical protein K1719_000128 [Acacia pycnantha]|nr:hypothetical protein K1719_000128 [Acacia pycnantha]
MAPITIVDGRLDIGFGFSPIVNDYKIVLIYGHFRQNQIVFRVKVFSLCTRLWKEIEFGNLKEIRVVADPVSANGHVFWLGFKAGLGADSHNSREVSFDIANEVLSLMPMPAEDDSDEMQSEVLSVHENNLAMLWVKFSTEDIYCIKLWVMDEGSGEEDTKPLYLYNLDSSEFKILDISDCGGLSGTMIHSYVESLVSISNFHVDNP